MKLITFILCFLHFGLMAQAEDSRAAAERIRVEDAKARAEYAEENLGRFLPVNSLYAPKEFSNLLEKCPKGQKACLEEFFAVGVKGDTPLGVYLIPENSYVSIKSKKKTLHVKLNAIEAGPNCSGAYDYGKYAWIGDETLLTSDGPVSSLELFENMVVTKDNREPSDRTVIRNVKTKEVIWLRKGAKLNPQDYFIKGKDIAKKSHKSCVRLGKKYSLVDWCNDKHNFFKKVQHTENADTFTSESIYRTNSGEYEFVVSFSPSC